MKRKGAGAVFGSQWSLSNHLDMDILFGASFKKTFTNLNDYDRGFFLLFRFSFGYNFLSNIYLMKKYVIVTVLFLLFTLPIFSQKNLVKFGFLHEGGTNYGFTYERSIAKNFSLLAQWGFVTDVIFNTDNVEAFQVGSGFYFEGRYYLQKEKDLMEGWHAGINLLFQDTELEDDYGKEYLKRTGFGATMGYQWIFSNHLTIDTMFGLGYSNNSTNIPNLDNSAVFILGANLGYNF